MLLTSKFISNLKTPKIKVLPSQNFLRFQSLNSFSYIQIKLPFLKISERSIFVSSSKFFPISKFLKMDYNTSKQSLSFSPCDIVSNLTTNMEIKNEITLTEKEKEIFQLLLTVQKLYHPTTTLRVAGGWVRDKLLGIECYDIDVALDNILGLDFAKLINQYFEEKGFKSAHVGLIQQNPEQSKHLETATMKIFNIFIDFVNLRTETYTNSRIPKMAMGTPQEDAFRRDLTINSLFYNLNENKLEDWTNNGINDLKNGIIRTPLEPMDTLVDDPLRSLRAIRFTSRFNFKMTTDLYDACSSSKLRDILDHKVSRERIGKEINGMFHSDIYKPLYAFTLLYCFNMYDIVFEIPKEITISDKFYKEKMFIGICKVGELIHNLKDIISFSDQEIRYLFLCSLLNPFTKYTFTKKKTLPVIHYIISESLKWPVKDLETVELLAHTTPTFQTLLDNPNTERKLIGLTLRKAKIYWKLCAVLSEVFSNFVNAYSEKDLLELQQNFSSQFRTCLSGNNPQILSFPSIPHTSTKSIERLQRLFHTVDKLQLNDVWELKPLLNGKQIQELYQQTRPHSQVFSKNGTWISKVLEREIELQLENPTLGVNECRQKLLELISEFDN